MKLLVETYELKARDVIGAVDYDPFGSSLYVLCDNGVLLRFEKNETLEHLEERKVADLGLRATSMSWFPAQGVAGHNDNFAASCSDGALRFIHKTGTIEKTIQAHEGAATCVKCSLDGSSLVSTGEDGEVKLWSRAGNLRSNLASFRRPIYSFSWGCSNDSVVVASGNELCILYTQTKSNRIQWEAQPKESGDILTVDWSVQAKKILCGGEDGSFRLFDESGVLLYVSPRHEHIISSVAWSPDGSLFLVSCHNQIELCDQNGWRDDVQVLPAGSITHLRWSLHGTKVLAGSSVSGIICSASIVDRIVEWKGYTARLCNLHRIEVTDRSLSGKGRVDEIEYDSGCLLSCTDPNIGPMLLHNGFREEIVAFNLAFNRLITCTNSQWELFSLPDLKSARTVGLKHSATIIVMSSTSFVLANAATGISVYSYDGALLSLPRFDHMCSGFVAEGRISVTCGSLAVVDNADKKKIHFFDELSGKCAGKFIHETEVVKIALSQGSSNQQDCLAAFIDQTNGLFIFSLEAFSSGLEQNTGEKLASQVNAFSWSTEYEVLAAVSDKGLTTWFYPRAAFIDQDLLRLSRIKNLELELGERPTIKSFDESSIKIELEDGSRIQTAVAQCPLKLQDYTSRNKWKESLNLCQFMKTKEYWATLAGLSLYHSKLNFALTALCALQAVDKVEYFKHIQNLPTDEGRRAAFCLYKLSPKEAVSILLQANPPQIYRAIKVNVRLFRFQEALDIALKCNKHINIVLWYRMKNLQTFRQAETCPRFRQLFERCSGLDGKSISTCRKRAKAVEERSGGNEVSPPENTSIN